MNKRGRGIGLHIVTEDELITLVTPSKGSPRYRFASLLKYCKDSGKELWDLTLEEKEQFIIKEEE